MADAGAVGTSVHTGFRRLSWTFVDQALFSGTTFLFLLVGARSLSLHDYGYLSLAFSGYIFTLGVGRAIAGEVLLIAQSERGMGSSLCAAATGALALPLSAAVAANVAVGLLLPGGPGRTFLALAVAIPAVVAQDAVRYVHFAMEEPWLAAANDLVRLVGFGVALCAAAALSLRYTPTVIIIAWAAPALVALLHAWWNLRCVPSVSAGRCWLSAQRSRIMALGADFVGSSGGSVGSSYAIAYVASAAELGLYQTAWVVMLPLSSVFQATAAYAIVHGAQLRRDRGAGPVYELGARTGVALAAFASVVGLAAWAAPPSLVARVLGSSWPDARPLVPFLTVAVACSGVTVAAAIGARALDLTSRTLPVRYVESCAVVGAVFVGGLQAGARGAAAGAAMASTVTASLWWWRFRQLCRTEAARTLDHVQVALHGR